MKNHFRPKSHIFNKRIFGGFSSLTLFRTFWKFSNLRSFWNICQVWHFYRYLRPRVTLNDLKSNFLKDSYQKLQFYLLINNLTFFRNFWPRVTSQVNFYSQKLNCELRFCSFGLDWNFIIYDLKWPKVPTRALVSDLAVQTPSWNSCYCRKKNFSRIFSITKV